MFKNICAIMGKHGMVDERIALLEEMYNASVRRMGLQILCSKALSRLGQLLAALVGIDRAWASVVADNLRSYVRDSDLSIGRRLSSSELYYAL
jgi:hypothetical protein